MSGDDGGGDTPVPMPNTAVKPSSADGTCSAGSRESRTLPGERPFWLLDHLFLENWILHELLRINSSDVNGTSVKVSNVLLERRHNHILWLSY